MAKVRLNSPFLARLSLVYLARALSIITVPIVANWLQPEGYGSYQYVLTLAGYGFILANWGFFEHGIRGIATTEKDQHKVFVQRLLQQRFILWLLGALITFSVISVFIPTITNLTTLFLALLSNLGVLFNLDFYYIGRKKQVFPAIIRFLGHFSFLIGVLVLSKREPSIEALLMLLIVIRLVESIILMLGLNFNPIRFKPPILDSFKQFFKEQSILGLSNKSAFLQNNFPLLLFPFFFSENMLGVYSLAFKLISVLFLTLNTANVFIAPKIASFNQSGKPTRELVKLALKSSLNYFLYAVVLIILITFFGESILHKLFGDAYSGLYDLLVVFSYSLLPITALRLAIVVFLNNLYLDKVYFKGALIGLVGTVFSVIIGFMYGEINWAIYGLSAATLLSCIYYWRYFIKQCNLSNN